MWHIRIAEVGVIVLACVTALAQSVEPSPQSSTDRKQPPFQPAHAPRRVHQIPCWRQAGIAAEMVNQRWKIEDQGKIKIAGVCNDHALSAEQLHNKIQQINEETDQEVAKLIPSKQMEALKACQAELDRNRSKSATGKELGPCGGVIPANSATAETHQHSH
jgi:hypothetical protein